MKKRIISLVLIIILLGTNYVFAIDATVLSEIYTIRQDDSGDKLNDIANIINDDIYIDGDYSAYSNAITYSGVKIYNYETNVEQTNLGISPTVSEMQESDWVYTQGQYYLRYDTSNDTENANLYYTVRMGTGTQSLTNVATILYENALNYKGKDYTIKLNVESIDKEGTSAEEIRILVAKRPQTSVAENDDYASYTTQFVPSIGAVAIEGTTNSNKVCVDIKYSIIDENGNEYPISGLLEVLDIDLNQGVLLENFEATNNNVYMASTVDTIKYKVTTSGTYIYSSTADNIVSGADAYVLISNTGNVGMAFTFDGRSAYSLLSFTKGVIKRYKSVVTSVENGTIDPTVTGKKDGESVTITYAPQNEQTQYLKSVTVDDVEQSLTDYTSSYTFSNIQEDHTISVVYANKYKVTFDTKGGTVDSSIIDTQYATQYVMPDGTATRPETDPTKAGYEFGGWKINGQTSNYDFSTAVNSDIVLEAVWNPINYNINYVLNGGINDSNNPSTYTVEDDINLQPATRTGYDFLGWYEDKQFTNSIDSISNRTGDITVYAKWEASNSTPYTVEHYKENADGTYELVETENLTSETDSVVTATPKEYVGFQENTTYEERVNTGTVTSDGSLVLKLYYDKIKYTVTFDPQNDTTIEDQIVKYQEKATKPTDPTKTGYEFKYWYYTDQDGNVVMYNFDDPVTSNIDLVAKWEEVKTTTPIQDTNKDNTVAPTVIPQTGNNTVVRTVIAFVAIILVAAFGIRYFLLKNKMRY